MSRRFCLAGKIEQIDRGGGSAQNVNTRDRMNLIPAIIAVSNVGADNADAIAHSGSGDLGSEAGARGSGFMLGREVIAYCLNHQVAVGVHYVYQIQG